MGRPALYTAEQRREKRRLKSRRWRAANLERAREITRECEKRRAAKRALAEDRTPGQIGRPAYLTAAEKKAKRAAQSREHYHKNAIKLRKQAADRERRKRAAIKANEYVAGPWGGIKLTLEERRLNDRVMGQKRRTRIRKAEGNYTAEDIKNLLRRQHGNCAFCLLPLGDEYHIDHYLPLIQDGPNNIGNLRLLHPKCNLSKGAQHPIDHALNNGMLCW